MPMGVKILKDKDFESILISMKDIWTLDLDDTYAMNPDLIDIIGIRIVIWDIDKLGRKRIISKPYTAKNNPFRERVDIKRVTNRPGSYLLEFKSEEELKKRSKTIQDNCSVHKGFKVEFKNSAKIIKDLIRINREEFDSFNLFYKKTYRTESNFPFDHLLIRRGIEEDTGNYTFGLVALLEDEEDPDSKFEVFDNEILVEPDSEAFDKYLEKTPVQTYCCIAKYVNSIEIIEYKERSKFNRLNKHIESFNFGYSAIDPLMDDPKEFASLLDYGISSKFLSSFKPGKSVFEYQLIGFDKESQTILGPIYVTEQFR